MIFIKKYFNLLILSSFLILLLISISFIIQDNLRIRNNSDILIKKVRINLDKFLYSSKINFVYTNIYDNFDKKNKKFIEFSKNKNNITNIFLGKIDFIKKYYENNKELPILKENEYPFIPFKYIESEGNLNNIKFEEIMKNNKVFKNYDYKSIPINYFWIKNLDKDFFILLSLPYDYDSKYINNKRNYIIILENKNKKYSNFFQVNLY